MTSEGYSTDAVAKITGGKFPYRVLMNFHPLRHILVDSRKLLDPASSLFIALTGIRHNGHDYIGDLMKRGVTHFIISEDRPAFRAMEASFIMVDDTLQALHDLASHHRRRFTYPVIGVTGSNGKTIVKEWLYQLMREDKNIVRSTKSFN